MSDNDRVMAEAFERVQNQVHRYFVAVHGPSYVYRAPETFNNALERWMLYATSGVDTEMADKQMTVIEVMATGYHPNCCKFPKSCSCTVYDDNAVTADNREQSAPEKS